MTRLQSSLRLALLAGTALLFAAAGTLAAGGFLWRIYGEVPGMGLAHNVASASAWLTAFCVLAAIAVIALPVALRPAAFKGKLLLVFPALLVASTALGMVFQLADIGTVGELVGPLSLTALWIIKTGLLACLAAVIILQRGAPDGSSQRRALRWLSTAALPGALLAVALLGALALAATHSPSKLQGFGGAPGAAPGAVGQAAAPATGNGQAQPGAPAAGAGTAPAGAGTAAGAPGGAAGGPTGRPGGAPGGPGGVPGGGPSSPLLALAIGTAIYLLFLGLLGKVLSQARQARDAMPADPAPARAAAPGEAGRALVAALTLTVAGLLLSQLLRPTRDNPPAQEAIAWDSPATKDLAARACMDCHSNETVWPWYTNVAPSSWLTVLHVRRGRGSVNLSALNALSDRRRSRLPDSLKRAITEGGMPPFDYLLMHPEARLSDAEKQQLAEGFKASLAGR